MSVYGVKLKIADLLKCIMKKREKTDSIVIHCSASPEGRDDSAADIRRWHLARGFSDIGYHYVVRVDGSVESGRAESLVGAHCVEGAMNRCSVGICYIGGMDRGMRHPADTRTAAQKRSILGLVRKLQKKYGIPDSRVFGHCEFAPKACPSFDVRGMLSSLVVAVVMAVALLGAGCARRVYVPSVRETLRADTVRIIKREEVVRRDRDTVLIRERGDTVVTEVVRWRERESVVRDTLWRAGTDSVAFHRVGGDGSVEAVSRERDGLPGWVRFLVWTGVAAILLVLWRLCGLFGGWRRS